MTGFSKEKGEVYKIIRHHTPQYGDVKERKLVLVDRNRDLYIVSLVGNNGRSAPTHKLASMASSVMWNDKSEVRNRPLSFLSKNRTNDFFFSRWLSFAPHTQTSLGATFCTRITPY